MNLHDLKRFTATKHATDIMLLIEAKLKSCRKWIEFHREFKRQSDFRERLREKFRENDLINFESDQTNTHI